MQKEERVADMEERGFASHSVIDGESSCSDAPTSGHI
ncbi:unnamed protein product [Dibothriocephalus latus]|uniref:Uncharacterized protein n=1 Tax=Dibothriocephalus latus TaxID=60516 RepID=A0A3P6QKI6_DIBLA|nr:unnamed protein product [Dibothriocephalus latus]